MNEDVDDDLRLERVVEEDAVADACDMGGRDGGVSLVGLGVDVADG